MIFSPAIFCRHSIFDVSFSRFFFAFLHYFFIFFDIICRQRRCQRRLRHASASRQRQRCQAELRYADKRQPGFSTAAFAGADAMLQFRCTLCQARC
jgi:hypothetical protein